LRTGALASLEVDLVGLELNLPAAPMQLPQNAPFYVPVILSMGGQPVSQTSNLYPADARLQGTLTGPGLGAPIALTGTLQSGLSAPGLPQAGQYTVSEVQLVRGSQVILNARQSTYTITCLGEVLLTSVSSSPMTMKEIREAGIQLQPGDYVGRRFEMVLSVGSRQVSLNVPVAIPVYNGLESVGGPSGPSEGLQIGNLGGDVAVPGLSVVLADIAPEKDPFALSRPSLSFKMRNNFKALLVIPGSIGYLRQLYKVNVVVFNALEAGSPFKVTHLAAKWLPPTGPDGQVGTNDDPLQATFGEDLVQPLIGPDGTPVVAAGQSAMATFNMVGYSEGSHALDFTISGQFEGGDLQQPVAISGTAHGKVLVQNPNFNLMLVHPDVVRRGQTYTLEAHLTNTSQTLANAVSLTIDKARLAGAQLIGDATQQVDTLLPGETVVMKFQLQAFISGQITSSYLYIDPGNTIGFQLTTGIGPRNVALNPDTLVLPDSLMDPQTGLPKPLQEAMLAALSAAYDVATSQKALPPGVLPIARGTITTTMAQELSQEGLFLGMGLDKARVWWDLWKLFTQNGDPGFDQLMRTTQVGADLRNALVKAWSWADSQKGPADRAKDLATFNSGLENLALMGIQGAGPGLQISAIGSNGATLLAQGPGTGQATLPMPSLAGNGTAWGASDQIQLLQIPMGSTDTTQVVLTNSGPDALNLTVGVVNPVLGQAAPSANSLSLTLGQGVSATLTLGSSQQLIARLTSAKGDILGQSAATSTQDAPAEPFQVLGVHRYDLSISGKANPYGTQVMVLFNRPNMPLDIPEGESGFQAASALVQVEANQFWRKVMAPNPDTGEIPPPPAALLQAYPRVISCYLEKPVGPYVQRNLTVASTWKDAGGNPIQGTLQWPIQSGLLPGGAVVKGHFRKLDGTGVPGTLTYWYYQRVNNSALDLSTGYSFADEEIESYYAVITNNVATEADGNFQLDYVPAPIGDYYGPFVLQGGFPGGTAFARASVLGNGQTIQMDLVLEGKGSVDGFVVDAQGQPIVGAQVMGIQQQQSSDFTKGTGGGSFNVRGVTDGTGHYRLEGLKTGIFSLQVLKDELGAVSGGQITTDGQVVSVNVVLQGKVGTIKARILDLQGQVRMDQAVRLGIPAGLIRGASATTWCYPVEAKPDADGWATFTKVPAGDVRLFAPYSAPTPATDWQGFLNPEQTLKVELRMVDPAQMASVQALVVDAAGKPVPSAYLKFNNSPYDMNFVAQTREDGTSSAVPVVPGQTLTGFVYHPNWVGFTATNSVVIQPGGHYILKAAMPARCVLTGRVRRPDGTPVAGAYVALPPVYDDNNRNRLNITNAQGQYTIANVPAGTSYRLAAVGPDLLTSVNVQVPVAVTDTALAVDLTLPTVGRNTLAGTVFQPQFGNNQRIPTNATIQVYGQLPNILSSDGGNANWGLPQTVLVGGISESDMLPTKIGEFSIPNLPAGPYSLTASSSLFPSLVTLTGDFGTATTSATSLDVYLKDNNVGAAQGKVVQADGQTPVAPGARVMVLTNSGYPLLQVLSQPGGTFAFPKVIPAGDYSLRVEDPQTGGITVAPFHLAPQEIKYLSLRLWGTGDLAVNVQDSNGNPMLCVGAVTCGTVTLQHSKSNLVPSSDMPVRELPLTPADKGTLVFPHLLEGSITVQLKDPSGLSGVASVEIPQGGGNQTITVRLQPVGRIQGTLLRADGTPVAAGRVDAYQGGRWLGTCPTFLQFPGDPAPVAGHFMFDPLPTGAIRLEAWDPDSRQVGQATVNVDANQTVVLTMTTLDTGNVTVQVLQEGQPVLKAGIDVYYQGGPAYSFSTQATADEFGRATFILPPGNYRMQAVDPVSLASGSLTFNRGLNAPAMNETLSILPVRSIFVTALPPPAGLGQAPISLAGWRVRLSGLNRAVLLDSSNQGTLQEVPVGSYSLTLVDDLGRGRASQPFQVSATGGAVQMAQLQARAIGALKVTVLNADGTPAVGVLTQPTSAWIGGMSLFTDTAGQAEFFGILQGSGGVSASRGSQYADGSFQLNTEGEEAQATITFAPTAALHGVVRDALGQPVPFVSVSCPGVPGSATDARGAFHFQGLPIEKALVVSASTAQGRTGVSTPITLAAGDDPEVDITLSAMGSLKGRVTDALRAALPSLGIQVVGPHGELLVTAATDQTGAFQCPNLPAGSDLTLKVIWDDGATLAAQQTFSIPGEGQTTTLNVALPPFVNTTGWTQDVNGNNLPMYVQLLDAQGHVLANATTTVDIPTFFFRYLKAGDTFQLKGYAIDTREAIALATFSPLGQTLTENHDLRVSAWPSAKVQLRYPDGSAAPGGSATLNLTGTGGLALGFHRAVAFDASGAVALSNLPPGAFHLQVDGLPWQGAVGVDTTLTPQAGIIGVDVPVLGLGSLELQLKYPDGSLAALPGIQARVSNLGEGGSRSVTGAFDANGHLSLGGLPLGTATVTVSGLPWQGPINLTTPLTAQGQTLNQDVAILGAGTLQIRLRTTLVPVHEVTQATVVYLRNGKAFPMALQGDGSFHATVPTGESLQTQVTSYVTGKTFNATFAALSQNGGVVSGVITLPALGQIHGRVVGADGQPRAGITVQLATLQSTVTDANGAYILSGVEVGTPMTLTAQDPLISAVSANLTLTQEGQDLAQDFQLKGFGQLTVHLQRTDGSDAPGIPVTVSGYGVSLSTSTDATGKAVFAQVKPDVGLTVTAHFPSGTVSTSLTLQSQQAAATELKESPRTHLAGRVRRQGDGQTWPSGATLQVSGAGWYNLPLNADGTFPEQDLILGSNTTLQLSVSLPGLGISLPGTVNAVVGGQTLLDSVAPGFGTIQGQVTLAGAPVASASVRVDNQFAQTDAQGLTSQVYVLLGTHRLQVSTANGMAWSDVQIQTDGQSQVVPLALANNAVALPASISLERLGLSVNLSYGSWIPKLGLGVDLASGLPATLSTPPQGYWLAPGRSLGWEQNQGDIHVTRILTTVGYGVREQLVFENRGTAAHTVTLSAQSGTLQSGQNVQLGTPDQAGGAWFSGRTLAWGKGGWVPTGMASSNWWSGIDTLLWPALTLQPGQSYSIWLGYVPHGQNVSISSQNDRQTKVPASAESVARALQRMIGQAPEWLDGIDPRLSNNDPAPTVKDVLPAWDGSSSINLLDPMGESVQALGVSSLMLTLTPKELLAPQSTVNWGRWSQVFRYTFLQVPPDGYSYTLATATPVSGDLAWGQSLDLKLGSDWAVFQFSAAPTQPGNHSVSFGDNVNWSANETLTAGMGKRWSTQTSSLPWTATQRDNSNLKASGTLALTPGALTSQSIQFPAYGSVFVQGPQGLGANSYYSGRTLTATSESSSVGSGNWSNGGFLFPAVPVGEAKLSGAWNLGSVTVQEGQTTTLDVPTGAFAVTALDLNGVMLSGSYQVTLSKEGRTNTYSAYYANPLTIPDLPGGEYTVGLVDPDSGAVVSALATITPGSSTPVTLRLGQNGSLSVTLRSATGTPIPSVWITATPTNGNSRSAYSDANGFAHFVNLGLGTANLTYSHVAGADGNDEPGALPTPVALVPGSDVPVVLTVPSLGSISVNGVTQAGDAVPNWYFSIPNAFRPGRRTGGSGFTGVVLGQPLVVSFGDGSSYPRVDAPAITPTADGQSFALTFPMGRLKVRLRRSDQSPVSGAGIAVSLPGATYPQSAATDAQGIATFSFVPFGSAVSCSATSGGAMVGASATFIESDQMVELTLPATTQLTVHLRRLNPNAPLSANGWYWSLNPGSDNGAATPSNTLDAVLQGLYQGSNQTVAATQYLNESLWYSNVGSSNNRNTTWTANLTQNVGQPSSEVTLTLPARASAKLIFQDPQGHVFTGDAKDTLSITVKQSTNPALMGSGSWWNPPASRGFNAFDTAVMPEVFPEGTHVFSLHSSLWGDLPDITFTVRPQDDGTQIQVPVVLDWLKTTYALRAVAGDGQTPVARASFQMKASGNYLGNLTPSGNGGVLLETDAVQGSLYVPKDRQIQFTAQYSQAWINPDETSRWIDTGYVDGNFHSAGEAIQESITLPLTAAVARLTETDGSDLEGFAAERLADQVLPMAQIQGVTHAIVLCAEPGPLSLTLYDATSGLGLSTSLIVPPVGQRATAIVALPAHGWVSTATLQNANLDAVPGPFWIGVGADSPGLVKPGLAQWRFDSSLGAPWQNLSSLNAWDDPASWQYPTGMRGYAGGFIPPDNFASDYALARIRVPLQGTLWIGSQVVDPDTGETRPGPFASQSFSLTAGEVGTPAFQEPLRTWLDIPFLITDGDGNPYASALFIAPAHAPMGWSYAGTADGSAARSGWDGNVLLNLPQGETVRVETAQDNGGGGPMVEATKKAPNLLKRAAPLKPRTYYRCGQYWFGFLELVVPSAPPADPLLLKADQLKGTPCGE
jgi:hypothetical protein